MTIVICLLALLSPLEVSGQEKQESRWSVKPFVFGGLTDMRGDDGVSDASLGWGHLWVPTTFKVREDLELFGIWAPVGPPSDFHHLQLKWRPERWLVDSMTVGKFQPRFGWEFYNHNPSGVPVYNFSGTSNLMVARDYGVEVGTHWGYLKFFAGAFLGRRTGGNVPESDKSPDFNLRSELPLLWGLALGGSFRESGEYDASGLDLVWRHGGTLLSAEGVYTREGVGTSEHPQYALLGTQELGPDVAVVARFERLRWLSPEQGLWTWDDRVTGGLNMRIGTFATFKFDRVWASQSPSMFVLQLILHAKR